MNFITVDVEVTQLVRIQLETQVISAKSRGKLRSSQKSSLRLLFHVIQF
jgi:hypothetical protein